MSICIDLAAPQAIADRDPGDEHAYPHPRHMTECPECGAPKEPEPTEEDRQRLWDDPEYNWYPPDGQYLHIGFGLMGGGYGTYAACDRCSFFHKAESSD